MTNSLLDRLARLLPPPSGEVAGVPWPLSRPTIGLDFPADFREFSDRYGGGDVMRSNGRTSLSVYGLCSEPRPGIDFSGTDPHGFDAFMAKQVDEIYSSFVFDGADEDYWGGTVYPVQPDSGGLLAWGDNRDGDIFSWLTEDSDPDRWPVIMWARGPATTFRFEGGMVEFLVSVLSGGHPEIDWLTDPELSWTMTNDWLHRLP
jgi:hypothetical protein